MFYYALVYWQLYYYADSTDNPVLINWNFKTLRIAKLLIVIYSACAWSQIQYTQFYIEQT